VELGLCDVIASDYLPSAMLASAFQMAAEGCCSLGRAIGLITSGPAGLAGLDDRGRLEVGRRADLVLVDDRGTWPAVVGVRRAGEHREWRVFG
jgi:alpha-D-ribose 1-methylphosphonate 5-triphosphate diphosphatase